MYQKNYEWLSIGSSSLLGSGKDIIVVEVRAKRICIVKFKDELFGVSESCPHAGASLSQGFVDKSGHIVCPLHGYRFNVKTGFDSQKEGYTLTTYPIQCRNDEMFLGLVETI